MKTQLKMATKGSGGEGKERGGKGKEPPPLDATGGVELFEETNGSTTDVDEDEVFDKRKGRGPD